MCKAAEADSDENTAEGARQLRSGCLRLVAEALRRFPDAVDYGFLWPRLFAASDPLMARIPVEVSHNSDAVPSVACTHEASIYGGC